MLPHVFLISWTGMTARRSYVSLFARRHRADTFGPATVCPNSSDPTTRYRGGDHPALQCSVFAAFSSGLVFYLTYDEPLSIRLRGRSLARRWTHAGFAISVEFELQRDRAEAQYRGLGSISARCFDTRPDEFDVTIYHNLPEQCPRKAVGPVRRVRTLAALFANGLSSEIGDSGTALDGDVTEDAGRAGGSTSFSSLSRDVIEVRFRRTSQLQTNGSQITDVQSS